MTSSTDRIFAHSLETAAPFRFDEQVAAVFPDMIQRSVPGYANLIAMTGVLARQYTQPQARIYDLGCSLGAAMWSMCSCLQDVDYKIPLIGIDNAEAMLQAARRHLPKDSRHDIQLLCANIQDVAVKQASFVVLNLVLQFMPLAERSALLQKIHSGLLPGGALLLSEKIAFEDEAEQQQMTAWHHAFKRANGYSQLEISQKRSALENVLIPETLQTHKQRLQEAGFRQVHVWFQLFNFVSLVALK
ncbi:MAG: carboxy-S-adenosyl-L-methionine synthase CmoA [gamma proteobacterium symbiont of Bathyaustriella thionipta]|nr:carboxy-S-adenosyl-L-methionine synthase CmoA [gamma proteobacterium symbiont of Bathyaustriella thionipta]